MRVKSAVGRAVVPPRSASPPHAGSAMVPAAGRGRDMQALTIGDVTVTSIVERDGPWRTPEVMFPAYDAEVGRRHLAEMDPVVFDQASGKMVITSTATPRRASPRAASSSPRSRAPAS